MPTEPDGEVFTLLPHEAARTIAQLRARVAELEAAAITNARRWTQELGRLGQRANTADTQLATVLDRLDQVRGELTTAQRDQATATARITDLRAAATVAHQRADTAEAAVERVRAALTDIEAEAEKRRGYRETQAAERSGLIMAISRIREALDAAGTPAPVQQAREPSTAEHGSWKPQIFPIVDALRALDWTDFNPTRLDDLADVAAVIAAELFPPASGDQPHNMPAKFTPHTGEACPNRIEVTGWGMTEREWVCGCDPRPDAAPPAETTSPSEAT
ncbi:hypothetical protein MXD62_20075 [Frankia sp. Mgl5]|uniref:hypothetical protein n=1 Tax=Frankia sp. Mgl5 TaxID=2933793 RepID=UPI00200BF68A|nr:hypothetical protein [Frankia sp. Mgl5]MCK9929449.1 hypothetical protein [Frankia sp. Mgl5]